MSDLLFDTCFLIEPERGLGRTPGAPHDCLASHESSTPWISWTVAGEFAELFGDIGDPACAAMLARFEVLEMGENTAGQYARIAATLRTRRQPIGANDLWNAAAARAADFPLVTNDTEHFGRVAGLKLMRY